MEAALKIIAYNDRGRRIGASHHRAVHSDAEVERIRSLRFDRGLSCMAIAYRLGIKFEYVRKICNYKIRCQVVAKTIIIDQ